ncbi:MAG: RecQ family ATP-dependent DNA helicase [Aphanocapsa feldmannii 277cV]|uniref:RecQ family ATP-dependent DNA helicase n=1 Tax=Aphanocapsa feldmannii 277cV TaxID=2507553 RepID=A0A524RQ04_9CHRO|nr:MAG: RecQ family ATP-dependent DNA helicase [Aphanocapsa feldmannii 277cV]
MASGSSDPGEATLRDGVPFRPTCLSLDLEVGKDNRIRALGAVRGDTGYSTTHSGGDLAAALAKLDDFADGASFLLGHNLISFDLPHLRAAKPDLRLLRLPAVDTLRLSPLAFPRNPYHSLVKHYQDGGLKHGRLNDPELDSRLALKLFGDEREALAKAAPDLLAAWHWLCTPEPTGVDRALDGFFQQVRQARRPSRDEATAAIGRRLDNAACATRAREVVADALTFAWPLAYALAWLSVAGGNSVMPPWVRHQFPEAGRIVRRLRDTACTDPSCSWCREFHDAAKELKRWFGYDGFRPEPADDAGRSMQQVIVEEAMAGRHALGILPTGTGKSLCYQVPALSRYDRTGALTVVISPLVALMADQVAGLEERGIGCCVTINGLLSMPERADALDRIRLGDAGILLIAPEQLRSRSLRRALDQRRIGAWVLDEAHCLSRWGHDFRPDYRYVGRFIREKAGAGPVPPVLCLTATAKPDVVEDITQHFRDGLGIELTVFDGGAERANLGFEVIPTTGGEKFSDIFQVLTSHLPPDMAGGAIVYCATRQQSEDIAEYLQRKGIAADRFHAGLSPEIKKDVQRRFIAGELRVIAATNAFGMGIDKPDVRLVIHADIPGSLENYLQEAGRAGRDRDPARCVLLYATDDVERQFGMSARSRLSREEIHGILRALRNLDRKKRFGGDVVVTTGEILGEDEGNRFQRDSMTDDTRVRTAVAWLEESRLLTREENVVQVFPSSLQVGSLDEAKRRLANAGIKKVYHRQLLRIAEALIGAGADEGVSTDHLMGVSGLSPEGVRGALYDLERFGIASNDTALTAFVHTGVNRSSRKRLEEAAALETALIALMREGDPDIGKGDSASLHLRLAAQVLRDGGLVEPLPERLFRIVRSIAFDGRGEDKGATGSLTVRKRDAETVRVTLHREWGTLEKTAGIRREAAGRLLEHLLGCLPAGSRGTDLLAETTLGKLLQAIESDRALKSEVRHPTKLLDRALLWLHEQEVLRLNKGLAVFRPAMTIRLEQQERRGFSRTDFDSLALHYKGQVLQIHVMVEFAERGLAAMGDALRLAMDYFALGEDKFLARWLPGRDREIGRQTTPASWRAIVESLKNPVQQRIVADDRERTNVLVLAGPGSGKTRVLVHRIAWLIRIRRENARGILALAYNRHAAVDIRRRLAEMIGDEARGVTVLTCHALAMRLVGKSFAGQSERPDNAMFRDVMHHAVALLRGEELSPEEADDRRDRLLAGFRWILVDEYQDVALDQYELISALAGRTLEDDAGKLTLFAVGDDDQNIYAFNGASVAFIRRFEADYGPKPVFLTANYRSTANIVAAANAVIEPAQSRMKAGHPIQVDRARAKDRPGGEWTALDPVSHGKVQILPAGGDPVQQARAVMAELLRLSELAPDWNWSRCAVIAREWEYLVPVRAFCEAHEMAGRIRVQMANEEIPNVRQLRETRAFVEWLRQREPRIVDGAALGAWVEAQPSDPWHELLRQAVEEHGLDTGGGETPVDHFIEWLAEWGRDIRRRQRGLLLLTAHRAKGLEFDHVAVLDGGWERAGRNEDPDAPRRLYYVAMTRARQTLGLASLNGSRGFQAELVDHAVTIRREAAELPPCPEAVQYRHVRATLKDVHLGFAGRQPVHSPIHRAIAALSIGDPLGVRPRKGGPWELLDRDGRAVGRLARSFRPPSGMRCRLANVFAVVGRSRELSEPEYRNAMKCDTWEVVLPELVFEPDR